MIKIKLSLDRKMINQEENMANEWLTVNEAIYLTGKSEPTMRRWCNEYKNNKKAYKKEHGKSLYLPIAEEKIAVIPQSLFKKAALYFHNTACLKKG